MNKRQIINKVKELEGLTKDEKEYLVNIVNYSKEYGLVWENKPEIVEEELKTKLPILKEVKEKAIIKDTKKENYPNHILIEGDNLHALTTLSFTHENKIDIIYIDPPYNTGNKDFVYNDHYIDKEDDYKHSKWLSFMSKRLEIAKILLKDDGVIFISIDENELYQLKLLSDEIFGEQNFIGQWNWFKSATPPNLSKKIKKKIEYIIAYEKQRNNEKYIGIQKYSNSDDPIIKPQNTIKVLTFPPNTINFKISDKTIKAGVYGTKKFPNQLLNDLKIKNGTNENEVQFKNRFIWLQDKLEEELKNNTTINCSKNIVISYKKSDYSKEVPPNFINEEVGVSTTEVAGKKLLEMFGEKVFDYPKPVSLIKYLLNFKPNSKNAIILDFFAGTGTTGQAVMELNKEDYGKRKFILCTNNELNGVGNSLAEANNKIDKEEFGICRRATYSRIVKVINGYNSIPGISENNLRYFQCDYIERKPSLKNKKKLTKLATELLCIREDCYYEITSEINKHQWNRLFTNRKRLYNYIVYDDLYIDTAVKDLTTFIESKENKLKVKVYVFSNGEYPYTEDFENIHEYVELCALPDVIYKAYQNVLPKISKF